MRILNKTDVPQSIKVITVDGKHDTIQLNRGKPVDLPPGTQIDPSMIAQYKAILKTNPPLVIPQQPAQFQPQGDVVLDNE